jgi:photosystem II stability/assembly factor-like uncharacterized protein
MRGAAALALAATCLLAAGCGDSSSGDAGRSERLVDFSKRPPYVNSFERDEESGEFLITTNRGFFRVDPSGDRVRRVRGTIEAGGKRADVGTFLELNLDPDGQLVGSGHPDQRTLPQYLGYLRSGDGGRTWRVVSRLGDADLHKIVFRHDRLYAWDAVLSALIVSEDGGRSFVEHFTPRGLIIDFEVDPEDPAHVLASTDEILFRSEDEGESWRPLAQREGSRLAWPEPDRLYLAAKDGTVSRSEDGGDTFDEVGRVDGEPYVLDAVTGTELYMALSDATILRSEDGGASWEEEFRP